MSLDDDNELRQLLGDIPSLIFKKFKFFNCNQRKPTWGGTYDTFINIPLEIKFSTAEEIYQFRTKLGKELIKPIKSKFKFRIHKSDDYFFFSIPFSAHLPLMNIYISSSSETLAPVNFPVIKITTHPDEIVQFNRKYDTTTQLEQLKLYTEKLLEACDILVKTLRLIDLESLK